MPDPVTVTTRTSWLSRLGSAFGGILTGLALFLVGIGLLFWNEGRSVQSIRANNEGAGAVTSVTADRIDPGNEGRLIHLITPVSADGPRRDPRLGLSVDALLLSRKVEYYQWVESSRSETRNRLGGGQETVTTYSYERRWTDTPQDSSRFQQAAEHRNPAPLIQSESFRAEKAVAGAFVVDETVLAHVSADKPLELIPEQAAAVATALARTVSLSEGALYVGETAASPQVGDMRIRYAIAPQGQTLSLIGAQTAGGVQPYPTRAGAPILMVRQGPASAEQMFDQARAGNQTLSWILRGVGCLVIVIGLGMVLAPLAVLADVVPLFGTLVRTGTGLIAGVIGLSVAAVVIASAWLVHRPLLAGGMIAAAVAVTIGLFWWKRRAPAR